jgi:hypothetical protein
MPPATIGMQKDKAERMEFLLNIYPNGAEYSQILADTKKACKVSDAKAKEKSDKLLDEMVTEGWIKIKERRNGSKAVLLDKKGSAAISAYMRVLKENDKRRYFIRLKAWMTAGDNSAKVAYARASMEVFLRAPEIACMLVTPHYEAHLVDYYARLTGKESDDDTKAFVMDYVGLLVGLGFAKMNKITDQQSGREAVSYYFLKDGLDVMRMMFKTITSAGPSSTGKSIVKPSSPWITWLSFLITFFSIMMISVSVAGSFAMDPEPAAALVVVASMAALMPTVIVFLLARIGKLGNLLHFKKK